MVNYADPSRPKPSEKVLQLLYQSGLMASEWAPFLFSLSASRELLIAKKEGINRTRSLRSMRITSKGFQFLLEDVNTQLWDLLLTYLESSEVSLGNVRISPLVEQNWFAFLNLAGSCRDDWVSIHVGIIRVRSSEPDCFPSTLPRTSKIDFSFSKWNRLMILREWLLLNCEFFQI